MNKYAQEKILGEGGFGKALLCRRKSDSTRVVIKQVSLLRLQPKEKQDAFREAKVLSSLRHPNIVQYIESFQEGNNFYIVMEYVDGGDLQQKIEKSRTRFPEETVLHDFIQIALALKYCHDRKILHRDLKTQNVFLMKDGTIKLGDFGIARVLDNTEQLCKTQIGTPYYLSPEICEGKTYNSKTDIWSLGCILYELCTGKHPFIGSNMNALFMQIVRGRYTPISEFYSSEIRSLVGLMLTKDPRQRPSINQILSKPFLKEKLSKYLDETVLRYEMNHTILHGRQPLAAPTVILSNESKPPQSPKLPSRRVSHEPERKATPIQKQPRPSLGQSPSSPKRPSPKPAPEHDPRWAKPVKVAVESPTSEERHRAMLQEEQRREQERQRNIELIRKRAEQERLQKIKEEEEKKAKDAEIRRKLDAAEARRKAKQDAEQRRVEEQRRIIAERERKQVEIQEYNRRMAEEKRRQKAQEEAERRKEAAELRRLEEEEEERKRLEAKKRRQQQIEERRKQQEEQLRQQNELKKKKLREEFEARQAQKIEEERQRREEERRLMKLEEDRKRKQAQQDEERRKREKIIKKRQQEIENKKWEQQFNAAAEADFELFRKRQSQIDEQKKVRRWVSNVDPNPLDIKPCFQLEQKPQNVVKLDDDEPEIPKWLQQASPALGVDSTIMQDAQQQAPKWVMSDPMKIYINEDTIVPKWAEQNQADIAETILQGVQKETPGWAHSPSYQRPVSIDDQTMAITRQRPRAHETFQETDNAVSKPKTPRLIHNLQQMQRQVNDNDAYSNLTSSITDILNGHVDDGFDDSFEDPRDCEPPQESLESLKKKVSHLGKDVLDALELMYNATTDVPSIIGNVPREDIMAFCKLKSLEERQ